MTPFSKNMVSVTLWIPIIILFGSLCDGGKILVVPLEGSHWVNMDIIIKALHDQGHNVDVIRSSSSWFIKENSSYYNTITIPVTKGINEEFVVDVLNNMIDHERGKSSWLSAVWLFWDMISVIYETHEMICQLITNILESEEILKTLKENQYDLLLTDPGWGAGIFLAHKLKLPMVYNVRWTTVGEGHFEIAPSPLSYIPITGSRNPDKMNFFQRVENSMYYLLMYFQNGYFNLAQYQALCDKYFYPPVRYYELLQGADIWLMRVDFVFEFPRPTMPNIIYIGGFQCKPAKALPHDLEVFMQSSGEHGVVIMSLGSFISILPDDITAEIAAAFAQLPQKVIWRYTGKIPSALGNNTLLVDWMPQNDLLGHPKTKVFIAHGGTNGVQEALYHGVPVVGIPLFFDQYDNLLRLQNRGGAKILSIATLDQKTLHAAIQNVISDPSYRLNMQRLSHLHRDTPVKPLDSALFWIEFVMRHKGAAHLRSESYKLPWYSYYSVDVAVTLFALVLIFTLSIFLTVKYLCFKCCNRKRKTE
ncbi:UDP-glucuronosyltransferase 2A1-like [Carassius carassius]|uniref:UDP-glucuronosyltransferase 2A1-like n=1 Tax=Carassius carassius TaxID=217509 RepID=UPI002868510A|nr:UDP-glucuronosyltransferase 2A1-like [Carassius carassius]XP_059362130.1 UDP-glucuronosyltransferase 2A1-like [Carassius carassius]